MKHAVLAAVALSLGLVASTASADEKNNATTLPTTTVQGRVQKPAISIVLMRARMQLGATTPTLASITKIHDVSKKDPF